MKVSVLAIALTLAVSVGATTSWAAGSHSTPHKPHGSMGSGKMGHGTMGHGETGHGHGSSATGEPGKAAHAMRTISIMMDDNFYAPKKITVNEGETVRFVVKNKGQLVHEFNIGTAAMHADHQKEMMGMMDKGILEADKINHNMMKMGGGMMHDDPNSVLLEPGKSGEVIWKFAKSGNLEFACNVPGHYEAGMKGHLKIHN